MGGVLAATLAMMSVAIAAEDATRDSIAVEGNHRVDAETIRSYFYPSVGRGFDDVARDAALKSLIATRLFDKVAIDNIGGKLVVRVSEAPVLNRVAFEGTKKVKDADLTAAIESKPRGTLQRAIVQSDVNRIVEAYRRVARDEVRVTPEIIDQGGGRVDLVYNILEGAKTPVRRIDFSGNQAFGKRQLSAVIKTSAHSMLSFLTGGDVYDPDRVAHDQEQLRLYYRSKGYADVSVAAARVEYDPVKRGFILTFAIDEGPRYQFGDIGVACNIAGLDPETLRRSLAVRNGAMFDGNALDKSAETLAIALARLGYPFAHAVPRLTRDQAARRVDVTFAIDQGSRMYVERIDIHGNTRTRDYVIRREFEFGEGDAYNKTLIDRAERRLKNLNYFKTVKISSRPGSSPDRIVLDIEAVDQPTGDFFISGGYSTVDGALVEVKVAEHNFYGTGYDLKASATWGQYARGINLSASEPYFLGTRVAAGIELFGRQTDVSSYQSYSSYTYGGGLVFGTPVTEELGVQWRYSLYKQNIMLAPTTNGLTPSLVVQQAAAAGPALVSQAGTTSTYSTLDNNKSPTSGVRAQLSQDIAGLGGDVKFLRTTEDVRYYHQLNSDLTGMVRAQGGYITGWGGRQAPLMNSFFGGPTMVRGFAPNGFGPRDLTAGSTMDNVGGSMYWATTAELKSSIPGVPDEYGLKASAFVDAGSVFRYAGPTTFPGSSQSVKVANSNVVRSSVGVGLTWASPFGALTIDYAVPLTKAAFDVAQPFRFSAAPF
jgi:outer membrane protein insertion porin family